MGDNLTNEQQLYNKFVEILLGKIEDGTATPKELEIVMKFLDNNNITANTKNKNLSNLAAAMKLPFEEEDELPIRRIK